MSPDDEGLLAAYLDGELDAAERARLEARLAREPALARQLDAERAIRDRAAALLGALEPPVRVVSLPRRRPSRWLRQPLAWAASVALAVVVGYAWRDRLGVTGDAPPREVEMAQRAPAVDAPAAAPAATLDAPATPSAADAPAPMNGARRRDVAPRGVAPAPLPEPPPPLPPPAPVPPPPPPPAPAHTIAPSRPMDTEPSARAELQMASKAHADEAAPAPGAPTAAAPLPAGAGGTVVREREDAAARRAVQEFRCLDGTEGTEPADVAAATRLLGRAPLLLDGRAPDSVRVRAASADAPGAAALVVLWYTSPSGTPLRLHQQRAAPRTPAPACAAIEWRLVDGRWVGIDRAEDSRARETLWPRLR